MQQLAAKGLDICSSTKKPSKYWVRDENQSTLASLLSTCPCFLTFHFTLFLSHCSITLSSFSACHLPPPDILSVNSLHCFLCLPVTLCQSYLKGAVKILGISHGQAVYFCDTFMPPSTRPHISHFAEIDACVSLWHAWQRMCAARASLVWCKWNALMSVLKLS